MVSGGDAAIGGDAAMVLDAAAGADAVVEEDAGSRRFEMIAEALASCDAERFDRALHDVAWDEGWPLRAGEEWLFATRLGEEAEDVRLVGDINRWNTERWPATACADHRRLFVRVADGDLDAPGLGSKYKWFVPVGGVYLAPPEATAYGYDEFGRFGWVQAPEAVAHLEQFPALASRFLEAPRTIRAYLPAGFVRRSESAARMKTLLLHDGQNVFHPDAFFGGWRVDAALAARGGDVVALAIDNAVDRMDAYTQVADDLGSGPVGGRAEDYLSLLREEVLPFFRARYGIVAEGRSLMVAGSSLGGLVTLVAVQHDFESLGCGAALSSTLGWGSIAPSMPPGRTLIDSWSGRHAALYIDSGGDVDGACVDSDGDGVEDDGRDSDNCCVNRQMCRVLGAAGYALGVSLRCEWARGATHDEAAWAARVGAALDACQEMGWTAP